MSSFFVATKSSKQSNCLNNLDSVQEHAVRTAGTYYLPISNIMYMMIAGQHAIFHEVSVESEYDEWGPMRWQHSTKKIGPSFV